MKITLEIRNTVCCVVAAALVLTAAPAAAQMYSWRDPATGQSRFSNIAPPWYSRREAVSGPRVIATVGDRVVDDTALPYADRLLLSGKPREYVEALRPPERQQPAAQQARDPARTQAAGGRPGDEPPARGDAAGRNKGS
jgi:hypothetical protein